MISTKLYKIHGFYVINNKTGKFESLRLFSTVEEAIKYKMQFTHGPYVGEYDPENWDIVEINNDGIIINTKQMEQDMLSASNAEKEKEEKKNKEIEDMYNKPLEKAVPCAEAGDYHQCDLSGYTAKEIEKIIGFPANIDDDDEETVNYSWGFTIPNRQGRFGIWDYKVPKKEAKTNTDFSAFGDKKTLAQLFGEDHIQ